MKCSEAAALQNLMADDMLPAERRPALERHMAACLHCRGRPARLERVRACLRNSRMPAPPALQVRVMHRAARRAAAGPLRERWRLEWAAWWRSWNRTLAACRLAAIPATAVLFALLLTQFSAVQRAAWYPVILAEGGRGARDSRLIQLSYVPMLQFAQRSSSYIREDSFVVLTRLDARGVATLEEVLEPPRQEHLLRLYAARMAAARYRPLQRNGVASSAYLIVPYQKISVVG